MIKSIIKHLIYGVAGGSLLFVLYIILLDVTGSNRMYEIFGNFTTYAVGFITISTGFAISGMVYDFDRIALWIKISINALVGFGVYFLVGSYIGIISFESPVTNIISVLIAIALFIAICLIDFLFSKREASKINAKLKEQDMETWSSQNDKK